MLRICYVLRKRSSHQLLKVNTVVRTLLKAVRACFSPKLRKAQLHSEHPAIQVTEKPGKGRSAGVPCNPHGNPRLVSGAAHVQGRDNTPGWYPLHPKLFNAGGRHSCFTNSGTQGWLLSLAKCPRKELLEKDRDRLEMP